MSGEANHAGRGGRKKTNPYSWAMRLHGKRAFDGVFEQKLRKTVGPLGVWGCANEVGRLRLGLSISRNVGNAVQRHRLKRMLREAFRLVRHECEGGYDVILTARSHEALTLGEYQQLVRKAIELVAQECKKRQARKNQEGG